MSPFLTELNQRIESSVEESDRADLQARRAIYLARMGNFEDSSNEVARLRSVFGDGRYPEVSILIMLAEGVHLYFESLSDRAYERISRAYALARALPGARCLPIVSGWLAHLEFESCRYDKLAGLISAHLAAAEKTDPSAHIRFCLVIADAFLFIGDRSSSQYWYNRARVLACSIGDRVSLGAIMYNRAAFGINYACASKYAAISQRFNVDPALLRAEAKASYRYQELTEVKALSHLSGISIARADILCGDYQSALSILEPLYSELANREARAKATSFAGELGDCLLASGRHTDAADLLSAYDPHLYRHLDLDDQVVLICSMQKIAVALNDSSLSTQLEALAAEIVEAYQSDQRRLTDLLSPWMRTSDLTVTH